MTQPPGTDDGIPLGTVLEGDCLDVMRVWPAGCVDLVYLDPPFNTGRRHRGADSDFDDRFQDLHAYLDFIDQRLQAVHRLLKTTGSVMLHCDWRTCHHLRCRLDAIFGADAFVNHLIWHYGLGGSSPRRFARKHDDILFYARGPDYYFEPPRVAATSNRMRGQTKKATDVLAIPAINNMARERTGYPTQKPVALLRLLIEAAAPPGGVVLDPFCGSGTTLVAARATGRRCVGVDLNTDAVALSRRRMVGTDGRALPAGDLVQT